MKWCFIFIFALLIVLITSKKNIMKSTCKRSKCLHDNFICGRVKNKISNRQRSAFVILLKMCDVDYMKCQGYQVDAVPMKNCDRHEKAIRHSGKTRVKRELIKDEEDNQESPETIIFTMPGEPHDIDKTKNEIKEKDISNASSDKKNVDQRSSNEDTEKESNLDVKEDVDTNKSVAEDDNNSDSEDKIGVTDSEITINKDIADYTIADNKTVEDLEDLKSSIEKVAEDTVIESKENEVLSTENEVLSTENEEEKGDQDNVESDHKKTDYQEDESGEESEVQKSDDNRNVDNITPANTDRLKNSKKNEPKKDSYSDNIGFPVDYDLQAANEGVDFEEYNKNCPTICPARDVMLCAKCKDGVYRTFMSVCHLRMFNCKHPDEKTELVSWYPCILSAPFLAEAPSPQGRVSEPSDKDVILQYIRCKENDKFGKKINDPRCKFSDE